jgi:hypothetical protein
VEPVAGSFESIDRQDGEDIRQRRQNNLVLQRGLVRQAFQPDPVSPLSLKPDKQVRLESLTYKKVRCPMNNPKRKRGCDRLRVLAYASGYDGRLPIVKTLAETGAAFAHKEEPESK